MDDVPLNRVGVLKLVEQQMFIARIQLRLHKRCGGLIVQQLKALARHIAELQLIRAALLRAVDAQQRHHTRPNVLVQTICLQITLPCGFEREGFVHPFPRIFKDILVDASVQTFELLFVQLEFLLTQSMTLSDKWRQCRPQFRRCTAVQCVLYALRAFGFFGFAGKHRGQNRIQRLARITRYERTMPRLQNSRFTQLHIKAGLLANLCAHLCHHRLCQRLVPQLDFIALRQRRIQHIQTDKFTQFINQSQIMRAQSQPFGGIELLIKRIPRRLPQLVVVQQQRRIARYARAHRRGLEQAVKPSIKGVDRYILP